MYAIRSYYAPSINIFAGVDFLSSGWMMSRSILLAYKPYPKAMAAIPITKIKMLPIVPPSYSIVETEYLVQPSWLNTTLLRYAGKYAL